MSKEIDKSAQEFIALVLTILKKYKGVYQGSLDNYLLALWALIKRNRNVTPSYQLFSCLIGDAFDAPPGTFDDAWLVYDEELIWTYQKGSDRIEEYKDGQWKSLDISDFELLQRIILFQITDLIKIPPEQLKDPFNFFGIRSPSGAYWYNLDVFSYWECAMAGMEVRISPSWQGSQYFTKCNWSVLAELLTLGRLYE